MNSNVLTRRSKFLSLILRHRPEKIGLQLEEGGWVSVELLLRQIAAHGPALSREELDYIVAHNNKKRFAYDKEGLRIRASQGHSVPVELGYQPGLPPELLYHGTVGHLLDSIWEKGLLRGKRHHVHLSPDRKTALQVGGRRGKAVVLVVKSGEMHRAGYPFFRSENGVWLTEHVPTAYLREEDE